MGLYALFRPKLKNPHRTCAIIKSILAHLGFFKIPPASFEFRKRSDSRREKANFKKYFDFLKKKHDYCWVEKINFMDQISQQNLSDVEMDETCSNKVSLETELSETLYNTMKDFVLSNPTWDQYKLINSALATFLVQNGCTDDAVSEIYLNQLFMPSKSF